MYCQCKKRHDENDTSLAVKASFGENYQNSNLSLETLCDHLHMSTAYFSTVFKKEEGESYISYLTGVRMKKAAELLSENKYTIAEVSYQVGIGDPFYFSKCFKQQFGVSPSAYVKKDKPE